MIKHTKCVFKNDIAALTALSHKYGCYKHYFFIASLLLFQIIKRTQRHKHKVFTDTPHRDFDSITDNIVQFFQFVTNFDLLIVDLFVMTRLQQSVQRQRLGIFHTVVVTHVYENINKSPECWLIISNVLRTTFVYSSCGIIDWTICDQCFNLLM